MTKKLEKWYVWDKLSVIEGAHRVLMSDGDEVSIRNGSPLGHVASDYDFFIAYTLGEQVESKRAKI